MLYLSAEKIQQIKKKIKYQMCQILMSTFLQVLRLNAKILTNTDTNVIFPAGERHSENHFTV